MTIDSGYADGTDTGTVRLDMPWLRGEDGAMVRMAALAALAASVALLCGCAASPRPTPLTSDEVAAFEAELDDELWNSLALDESQRPRIESREYVSYDDVGELFGECVAEQPDADVDTGLAYYRCNRLYPVSPTDRGYFSADELDALYDYFQKSLVPCLELHGFEVSTAPPRPTRDAPGYLDWHPFWTLQSSDENPEVWEAQCPFLPAWARSE